MVYDVTDYKTFLNVMVWLLRINEHRTAAPAPILILGNKADQPDNKRQVSASQGKQVFILCDVRLKVVLII